MEISKPLEHIITVYLSSDISQSGNSSLFDLYILEISYSHAEIKMFEPHKVYSVLKSAKSLMKFENFSKDFFLLNLGRQILAVMKQGYMVDCASVNIFTQKSFLRYMGRNRLLLITQTKIQQYYFNLDQSILPYRIDIKPLDSIQLPSSNNFNYNQYQFIEILAIFTVNQGGQQQKSQQLISTLSNYILLFQLKSENNKKLRGEVSYSLALTKLVNIKEKIKQLFSFNNRSLELVPIQQIEEKVDMAKKIGMNRKDIYLELWNRTKKKTIEDYRFLFDTLDYEIISKEIEKKLKKQAMLFTQIYKIESTCYHLLKKVVKSQQCTQMDIKNYIISHFKLQKYQYYKDVRLHCGDQYSYDTMEGEKQNKLKLDIQNFYAYTQIEIKSFLLQLFHQYFYEYEGKGESKLNQNLPYRKKLTLLKIKILMNNFRFQLKIIYEDILTDLIKLTKDDAIVSVLNRFPQLLPISFTQSQQQVQNKQSDQFEQHLNALRASAPSNAQQIKKSNQLSVSNLQHLEMHRLRRSLSRSTNGQIQLQGIWPQISSTQWQNALYLDSIETIYNKHLIASFSQDVWFKRNLYTQHDFILKTKAQIQENQQKLKSNYTIYFFIDKIYKLVDNVSVRKQVIETLQRDFQKIIPQHLKGRIELYHQLFIEMKKLFKQSRESSQASLKESQDIYQSKPLKSLYEKFIVVEEKQPENRLENFKQFLKLQSAQLFHEFVKLELIMVRCLYGRIKPIYQKFSNGKNIFNESISNFFESDLSEISHLKCLLNRLNSESKQFHYEHFQLFQVLVKSVLIKTKIGKLVPDNEYVNPDQLRIYIRDIYMRDAFQILKRSNSEIFQYQSQQYTNQQIISLNQSIQNYFNMIQCVSENKDIFKEIKISTTLYEIYEAHLNKTEKITELLIQHLIQKCKLNQAKQYQEEFFDKTCEILTQSSSILNKLFNTSHQNELFFIYLWKIMQNQEILYKGWVERLLNDQSVQKWYKINDVLKENLFLFMSRYKFSKDQHYLPNIKFLKHLLNFLNDKNKIKKYFTAQINLILQLQPYTQSQLPTLTKQQISNLLKYPLTENSEIISSYHIDNLLRNYSSEYLITLNLEKICQIINEMQLILLEQAFFQNNPNSGSAKKNNNRGEQISESDQFISDKKILIYQGPMAHSISEFENQKPQKQEKLNGGEDTLSQQNYQLQQINQQYLITNNQNSVYEVQVLIRQSARAYNFFSDSENQNFESLKKIGNSSSNKILITTPKSSNSSIIPNELKKYLTHITQFYEIVVRRLINSQMVKESIHYLEYLLAHSEPNNFYVVYPLHIMYIISKELTSENKFLILKICSHFFKEPIELLETIKTLIGNRQSGDNKQEKYGNNSGGFYIKELNNFLKALQISARIAKFQLKEQEKSKKIESDWLLQQKSKKLKKKQSLPFDRSVTFTDSKPAPQTAKKFVLKKKLTIQIYEQENPMSIHTISELQLPKTLTSQQLAHPMKENYKFFIKKNFSYDNPLISQMKLTNVNNEQSKKQFINNIWAILHNLQQNKEIFRDFELQLLNIMLMQEPYAIAKYLDCKKQQCFKFKSLLSYFNQMIKQQIFKTNEMLQFGKRIFFMLYSSIVDRSTIEYQIRQYNDYQLSQQIEAQVLQSTVNLSEANIIKFKTCIQAFTKKQRQIKRKIENSLVQTKQDLKIKKPIFSNDLSNRKSVPYSNEPKELELTYHNINDSFLDNNESLMINPSKLMTENNHSKIEYFDPLKQRQLVYSRGDKKLSALLSNSTNTVNLSTIKSKLSPKSIRSSVHPASTSNKKSTRPDQPYFNKKLLSMVDKGNGINNQHHESDQQSIIFQQDGQSQSNDFIQPPMLKEGDFIDNDLQSSESQNLQLNSLLKQSKSAGQPGPLFRSLHIKKVQTTNSIEIKDPNIPKGIEQQIEVEAEGINELYTPQMKAPHKRKRGVMISSKGILQRSQQQLNKHSSQISEDMLFKMQLGQKSDIKFKRSQKQQTKRGLKLQIKIPQELSVEKILVEQQKSKEQYKQKQERQPQNQRELVHLSKLLTSDGSIPNRSRIHVQSQLSLPPQLQPDQHGFVKPISAKIVRVDQNDTKINNPPNPQFRKLSVNSRSHALQEKQQRQKLLKHLKDNSFVITQMEEIYERINDLFDKDKIEPRIDHNFQQSSQSSSLNLSRSRHNNTALLSQIQSQYQSHSYLLTKLQLYDIISKNCEEKEQKQQLQNLSSDQFTQQLKSKLFYTIIMKRLVQRYTTQENVYVIAKIIEMIFKKKVFLIDFYYEFLINVSLKQFELLVLKSVENANKRKVRNISSLPSKPLNFSNKQYLENNSNHFTQLELQARKQRIDTLLDKIPLNILQFRKKQILIKLSVGQPRKQLLEVMVKVFQKKRDKHLGEEVYNRLKGFVNK